MAFQVTVGPKTIQIHFEVGSIKEATSILLDNQNDISALFAAAPWATDEPTPADMTTVPARGKPGRKPRNQPDPSTASAPPPIPVAPPAPPVVAAPPIVPPPAPPAPPAPSLALPPDGSIPPFLQRSAPAAPPPPVVSKKWGGLIEAELRKRAGGAVDGGKALADWLGQCGVTIPGASFEEAMAVLGTAPDSVELEKVGGMLGLQ